MWFSSLSKVQKICICCFGVAFAIFIVGGLLLLTDNRKSSIGGVSEKQGQNSEALVDEMDYYPSNILLNEPVPELKIYKENGEAVSLSSFKGQNTIFLFWGSWCKYCKAELGHAKEFQELLNQYSDVQIVLINKLDTEKETKVQAEKYLKDNKITFQSYYDENLTVYKALGIKIIPTALIVDSQGILRACNPGSIDGVAQLEAMIDYVRYGGAYRTEQFITNKLTNTDGGLVTRYRKSNTDSDSDNEVLSESQGIMMEYAVRTENKNLFDRYLAYVQNNMLVGNSLAAWKVTKDGKAKVNALIDDLRIYQSLFEANRMWGGYDELLANWKSAILKYNTKHNHFIDFFDFKGKDKANRLTLCYADLSAVKNLTEGDASNTLLYDNTLTLLKDGYIGDEFPLYYSWYDFNRKSYQKDDLNMAEAMVTLLNLAKAGELKPQTVDWLRKAMDNGGIKARYTVEGKVADDYNYESTAIYALLAMVAKEIEDKPLMTKALARMELMRVEDEDSEFDGSFGMNEGNDIYSFDQCMALLAYAYTK